MIGIKIINNIMRCIKQTVIGIKFNKSTVIGIKLTVIGIKFNKSTVIGIKLIWQQDKILTNKVETGKDWVKEND